ncbi:MAG TPA: TMEM165/GDT1 family protein [Rhizomicrobium sp.]
MRELFVIFATVFLAELGDKTQLATVLFAADQKNSALPVFFAAAAALVLSTAIAVLLGTLAERYLTMIPLKLIAGLGFIAIGVWTVAAQYRGA